MLLKKNKKIVDLTLFCLLIANFSCSFITKMNIKDKAWLIEKVIYKDEVLSAKNYRWNIFSLSDENKCSIPKKEPFKPESKDYSIETSYTIIEEDGELFILFDASQNDSIFGEQKFKIYFFNKKNGAYLKLTSVDYIIECSSFIN